MDVELNKFVITALVGLLVWIVKKSLGDMTDNVGDNTKAVTGLVKQLQVNNQVDVERRTNEKEQRDRIENKLNTLTPCQFDGEEKGKCVSAARVTLSQKRQT